MGYKNNNGPYFLACGYSFKIHPKDSKDAVHDAYIIWYNKTGKNLFLEHRGIISQVVKNVVGAKIQNKYFMYRGVRYPKTRIDVFEDTPQDIETKFYVPTTQETPESILITKELFKALFRASDEYHKYIIDQLSSGKTKKEVAAELGVSRQLMTHKINKINETCKSLSL